MSKERSGCYDFLMKNPLKIFVTVGLVTIVCLVMGKRAPKRPAEIDSDQEIPEKSAKVTTTKSPKPEFRFETTKISENSSKYKIYQNDQQITYRQFLELLGKTEDFREFFRNTLASSPFAAFRFETPAINNEKINRDFEFIILNSPHLVDIEPDTTSFREHWSRCINQRSCIFMNLGRSSTLIAPVPTVAEEKFDFSTGKKYSSIAPFVRDAPKEDVDAVFKDLSVEGLKKAESSSKAYISTEGSGVYWLHIRIDPRPKYYGSEYRYEK